jgi:hypothetical protein
LQDGEFQIGNDGNASLKQIILQREQLEFEVALLENTDEGGGGKPRAPANPGFSITKTT